MLFSDIFSSLPCQCFSATSELFSGMINRIFFNPAQNQSLTQSNCPWLVCCFRNVAQLDWDFCICIFNYKIGWRWYKLAVNRLEEELCDSNWPSWIHSVKWFKIGRLQANNRNLFRLNEAMLLGIPSTVQFPPRKCLYYSANIFRIPESNGINHLKVCIIALAPICRTILGQHPSAIKSALTKWLHCLSKKAFEMT